jgi:hypothetical protein
MSFGKTTPILRIFDDSKAKEFCVGFLGFKLDWEHRSEPGLPLYMQVSRDGCVLHQSSFSRRPTSTLARESGTRHGAAGT